MANPASLIALASGRLTLLSRSALAIGLGLFLAILLLVRPVHTPSPRLIPSGPTVLALDPRSPWVERATLQEGAGLFMPAVSDDVRSVDAAQPDALPFHAFGPEFRHDPTKPLSLPVASPSARWPSLDEAFPLLEGRPYASIGQRPPGSLPKSRILQICVFSDINETVTKREIRSSDSNTSITKLLQSKDLKTISPLELRLGIDGMGLQSEPYLLRTSGDNDWDREVLSWARGWPWATWLRPGSYRVVIGL